MKTNTLRTMLAAAALVVAAGTASAQTFKAEVPIAFTVGNKTMAPGSYDVRLDSRSGTQMVVVRNSSTHTSAVLASPVRADASKAWVAAGNPMIAFECAGGSCRLSKLWTGSGSSELHFQTPKSHGETVTLALIRVR